jgi:ABC-type spermidine/putrescine transport system permease subunit II
MRIGIAMNRSFLIIILPAIAVGLGYVFMFHWLGYAIEPFRFVVAAIVVVAAVVLVQKRKRGRASRGSH